MVTYTLKVIDIKKETQDTLTLSFKQPGLRKIKYLAGQYLTLIFRINGRRYIRPYSFSSCPGIDPNLEITVKRVLNGIVSNHIHDIVKIGDCVEVFEPMGDFVFKESTNSQIYLWGVGSGITPLISLAKYILTFNDVGVNLIYGNKNHESTIFGSQIKELQNKFSERFMVKHFHTRFALDQNNGTITKGRINQLQALSILEQNSDVNTSIHYICGPSGLKESVREALLKCGVPDGNILSEDFELLKDPKDFESIYTQTVKLKFNEIEFNVEVVKGKSILEAALDADIELPYSCQTGNCSTCKAKLISGRVKMIGLTKGRNDLLSDEYLICCTHPLTDNVYIEV
ncbi:hypothetical protein DBR11_19515 [Pedobacter sp. HMWF019]|uniref:flavin reductase family protein n=1 Tax=Pedobacter sp. HMWF019 TaxID=2056856 RepID=UPI000D3A8C73|nr:iron-sulfur cluster-binding domain-containing protein [Pedobacter sp. HMWF019]PTS96252.1 hypothetical protein DBR11_19515 [Pedobacter sp. HMWF019]